MCLRHLLTVILIALQMVPMCRKLIDLEMLTAVEKEWLNSYHQQVLEKTKSFFTEDEMSRTWLERECEPY